MSITRSVEGQVRHPFFEGHVMGAFDPEPLWLDARMGLGGGADPIAVPGVARSGTLVVHRNWFFYYNGGH
jgi:hypothetical protein